MISTFHSLNDRLVEVSFDSGARRRWPVEEAAEVPTLNGISLEFRALIRLPHLLRSNRAEWNVQDALRMLEKNQGMDLYAKASVFPSQSQSPS